MLLSFLIISKKHCIRTNRFLFLNFAFLFLAVGTELVKGKRQFAFMRNIVYILFGLIWSITGFAQSNLVLNPGFEKSMYSSEGTREIRKQGYLATNWYNPLDKRSPHYFISPERSVAKANSGVAAVGLVLGGAKHENTKFEYITGELSKPLVKGQAYCVSFNILLHRSSKWATSNIGVMLHHDEKVIANVTDLLKLEANLYANDGEYVTNTKWQKYNGYFIASGGEKHISFGTFGQGESIEVKELGMKSYFQVDGFQSKAYYQLDDISVIAQNDSVDCGCAVPPVQEIDTLTSSNGLQPYLFALDASGSMRKDGVFDSLRNNLAELLEQLPMGTPVTFSTFSSNSQLIFSGELDHNTPREVDSLLSEVKLGSGTSVYSGLEMASKSWPSEGRDSARIVLISDGVFSVTTKIVNIVKNQYENKGRLLTVVQVESKAKSIERLDPYQTKFIHVTPSELRSAIFQIYKTSTSGAIACECVDAYSDTMNYHFVIDYSGSMSKHKNRAIKALSHLYEKVPPTAVVSITAFSQQATELYIGRKSEMTMYELDALLQAHIVKGGTDPTPGVEHGLGIAKKMSDKRFSHLIIITDLKANTLNGKPQMRTDIQTMIDTIDLAASSIAVDLSTTMDLMVSGRAQFDATTGVFREVSRMKFEKDLFDTMRSACDYTTQAYHYNPAKDFAKKEAKKVLKLVLKELMNGGVSMGN